MSLRGINLVNDALEGGRGDVAPVWMVVGHAQVILGVLLFPVSPVGVSIASMSFATVDTRFAVFL